MIRKIDKSYGFILLTLGLCLQFACKDFIDIAPEATTTIDKLYTTDDDFRDAVNAGYTALQLQYQDFWIYGDVPGDDSQQEVVKNDAWYFADAFTMQENVALLNETWSNYYVAITRMNLVLDKITDADPAVVTNKERYIGEARLIRALAYFDLVRIFGGVPMVLRPLSTQEAYGLAREDVGRLYTEVIIPDLLAAAERLPPAYSGADVGRATKGAAKSLLGRVYLTVKDFGKAQEVLQEVTTMGYALLPAYEDLFDYGKDEHHSEYIFDIEYEEGLGDQGSEFTHRFMPNSSALAEFYGIRGGDLSETNSPTPALRALFDEQDKRKDVTVGTEGGFYNQNGVFVPLPAATSQNYTKKYMTPVARANDSPANWKVIRYADVLLMYAEALNENGNAALAVDYLNQVRRRADVSLYAVSDQEDIREKIYQERRLELAFEGHRWFDLVRTGKANDVLAPLGMRPYMTLFPIPLTQIQVINNQQIFAQNPGYN